MLHPPGTGGVVSLVPLIETVGSTAHEGILNERNIPLPQEASIVTESLNG